MPRWIACAALVGLLLAGYAAAARPMLRGRRALKQGGSSSAAAITDADLPAGTLRQTDYDYFDYSTFFEECGQDGLLCVNFDVARFLDVQADQIAFDGTPLVELQTNVEGTGAAGFVSDFLSDTFSTSAGLGGRTFLQGNIGAAGYLQDTATDVTGFGTTVDASDAFSLLPDSISTLVGSTSGESLFNARAFNPRLQYVLGANFGLPTGFALATEAGKK